MNIGIVLVTYNRKKELEKALRDYESQSFLPNYIIVVNNNSTDGTREYLEQWLGTKSAFSKYVVNLNENLGGSGGFYEGLKNAIDLDADWIWVSDDDAFPEHNALEHANKFLDEYNNMLEENDISAICGTVINNGNIDTSHRRRIKKNLFTVEQIPVSEDEYIKKSFELDLFSYVGTIINKKSLKKVGLTEKDYFIYYDDTEHSLRLSKVGKILCVPNIKIIHNIAETAETINWKSYYSIRNKLNFYKKHFDKKYYMYLRLKFKLSIIARKILKKDKVYIELIKSAIEDEKNSKNGLHCIYKPGWKHIKKL